MAPVVSQTAADMMAIDACVFDYNARVNTSFPSGGGPIINPPTGIATTISGHPGTKYSFSPPNLADQDICGWYFIPTLPPNSDPASTVAYGVEASAFGTISASGSALYTAATTGASGIINIMPRNICGADGCGKAYTQPITMDPSSIDAVVNYQIALGNGMVAVGTSMQSATQTAVQTLEPYGWVFAGALLNMVARIQAMVSNAATAGEPQTHPPGIFDPNAKGGAGIIEATFWPNSAAAAASGDGNDIRKQLAEDMTNYSVLTSKTWAQKQSSNGANAQCAAMIGLQESARNDGDGGGAGNWFMKKIFSIVDQEAVHSGVWTSGTGEPCAPNSPEAGLNTFRVRIQQITGGDPLAELAALGHANLDTAFALLGISLAATATSDIVEGFSTRFKNPNGLGARLGAAAKGVGGAAATILSFIALIFMVCGFTLAYILPMFPYARFFFAVLVWVAAMLEAVIAVPLIALAHLNPEGEGLPGQSAKNAYFYVFNILLRPILMIFGLVCGLLLFFIAISRAVQR